MFGYLRRSRNFEPAVAQFYAAEIALILVFLHGHGVVYRDLKPENILFDARGHVKLVDFGFAKVVGDRETYTLCGTPEYLSPEVIQSKGHGKAVDWWALGVLIYEMILGYPPFYDNSPIKIYEKIVTGRISFPAWLPPDTKDIIQRLCTKDLSSRLGNMKGGGYEVMMHPFFRGINWRDLERQMHQGPFVPQLRFPGDTQYFEQYDVTGPGSDEEYTDAMFKEYDKLFEGF
jgi:protein kinase A